MCDVIIQRTAVEKARTTERHLKVIACIRIHMRLNTATK